MAGPTSAKGASSGSYGGDLVRKAEKAGLSHLGGVKEGVEESGEAGT